MRVGSVVVALAFASACSNTSSDAPAGAADPLPLASARDDNADPAVLEVALEARESTTSYGGAAPTPVWSYNGAVPGPLLDAKVGDRVIIQLKNSLPEPTSVHWHGVRLPAAMDGTMAMQ